MVQAWKRWSLAELRTAALIATTSVVMLVRKDLPANNIDEFVARAKGMQPTYGSVGIGSLYHLVAEKFALQTGLTLTHVPYKGGAPLITDVAGGQVDMAFFPLAGPVPGMIKEGMVKVLGISQPQPHPMLPDVPPMSRHKLLPGFDFDIWIGVQVPGSTPEAAVQRIHDAMAEVLKLPDVRKGIEGTGGQAPKAMTLAETDRHFAAEIERYRAVAKSIRLQPQ